MPKELLRFQGLESNFQTAQKSSFARHAVDSSQPPVEAMHAVASAVAQDLVKLVTRVQNVNGAWLDGRFALMRQADGIPWSVDGALFDEQGQVAVLPNDEGEPMPIVWSTLSHYSAGVRLPLSPYELYVLMRKHDQFLLPLTPKSNQMLFYWANYEDEVAGVVNAARAERKDEKPFIAEVYPVNPEIASHLPSMIKMTRVEQGLVADRHFEAEGVVRGKVDFSQNDMFGEQYNPRLTVRPSTLVDHPVFVSTIPQHKIVLAGKIPVEERETDIEVIRAEPLLTQADAIASLLTAITLSYDELPTVFAYNTQRPWTGMEPMSSKAAKRNIEITTRQDRVRLLTD